MSDFDDAIAVEYNKALAGVVKLTDGDVEKARAIMTVSAMAAANVDGKFTEGEYRQGNGLIHVTSGGPVSYATAKSFIEKMITGKNSNEEFVSVTYDSLLRINVDVAFSYLMFLIFICCADGDASWKERKWLKRIYK